MHIANPIYDVVFKYLMEDQEIAKLIISTITGEEIVDLEFLPQESTLFIEQLSLTVYRLDFSAKIRQPDGTLKLIIIEIQKAKLATDIMRFRRYLGEQYSKKTNIYQVTTGNKTIRKGMPVVSIYFLGYRLDNITAPVIKVARHYYDVTTGKEIPEREDFIESLTHDSYVIQIPHLGYDRRSEVEELLAVFDQHRITADEHTLDINEDEYQEKYQKIIRRLERANANPEVRRTMDAEDEIIEELRELERVIELKDKELAEKNQALDQVLEEKDQVLEEKTETIENQCKKIEEQQKIIAELQKRLQSSGQPL
ncbi:MAG: hypothetical protein GY749_36625 [Desulfobacteraceae bacterium]|nr:hypothetical protein [Desulfobacteraceae bacterium]